MKNSDEFLNPATKNGFTPKELEIIDAIECGSSSMRKQRVNEAVIQLKMLKHTNEKDEKQNLWYKKSWRMLISISTGIAAIIGCIKLIWNFVSNFN